MIAAQRLNSGLQSRSKRASCVPSGCQTPRTGRNTPFVEDTRKAVFLSGLKKVSGQKEYMEYRNICYDQLQMNMGRDGKIYIRRFDFPKDSDHAFLHLKSERMARFLKNKRTITLDGEPIKVYDYSSNRSDHEDSDLETDNFIINIENAPTKIMDRAMHNRDSCYVSTMGTPHETRPVTPFVEPAVVKAEEPVAVQPPVISRQTSAIDNPEARAELHAKLNIFAQNQNPVEPTPTTAAPVAIGFGAGLTDIQLIDAIKIPMGCFTQEDFTSYKLQGFQIVKQGLLTVEEFNQGFADNFLARLRKIAGGLQVQTMAENAANVVCSVPAPVAGQTNVVASY